jgi:hypothetical protein
LHFSLRERRAPALRAAARCDFQKSDAQLLIVAWNCHTGRCIAIRAWNTVQEEQAG